MKSEKHHVFNITQFLQNPKTGETLIEDVNQIDEALRNYKTLAEWAYVIHDKDTYTAEEEVKHLNQLRTAYRADKTIEHDEQGLADYIRSNQYKFEGDPKPAHIHIVIRCNSSVDVAMVSKWLGIPQNQMDFPKSARGRDAFLDCVQYLTHEDSKQQELGKHLYSDDEIVANFDFRERLDKREEDALKYGADLSARDKVRFDVLYNGKSLKQCIAEDRVNFMQDLEALKKLRAEYISRNAPLPNLRINFYIDGAGGIGKNTASKALAKALYPDLEEEDCYFEVGGNNVSFDGYDGQPVIIWNDVRGSDLVFKFGRGEVFDLFDSHPSGAKHNIKYGSVKLVNTYNIVNGIDSYQDFLNSLAGEYTDKQGIFHEVEDKSQSFRRFPLILCLREYDFDVLLNKGVVEGTREYDQYIGYKCLEGSFKQVAMRLEGKARQKVEVQMLEPTLNATKKIIEQETVKISNPDDIPDDFSNYGKVNEQKNEDEIEELPFS